MIAFGAIQAHAQQSALLHGSSTGTFKDWGWPADGPALDLTFDVADKLRAPPTFNGPLIGGQQLHILVGGTLAQVTDQNGAQFYLLSGNKTSPVTGLQGQEMQVTPTRRMGTADAYLLSENQSFSDSAMTGTVKIHPCIHHVDRRPLCSKVPVWAPSGGRLLRESRPAASPVRVQTALRRRYPTKQSGAARDLMLLRSRVGCFLATRIPGRRNGAGRQTGKSLAGIPLNGNGGFRSEPSHAAELRAGGSRGLVGGAARPRASCQDHAPAA